MGFELDRPSPTQTQSFSSYVDLDKSLHISKAQFLHLSWLGRCVCGEGAVNNTPPPRPVQPACELIRDKAKVEVNMSPLLLLKQVLKNGVCFYGPMGLPARHFCPAALDQKRPCPAGWSTAHALSGRG